ncbi:hypothetical protein N7478_011711 [Penicillium angulare]|uniref:uncharacterized protein n=1 Tax=Penicillium angulare TaxID=116970 RepID=UPI00254207A6|nr:uncharacterized protein N7478_011711 [Penicillium angulare]KAJ5261116.1 hypothetical protein N7478_011711 [Penicillium angulare]
MKIVGTVDKPPAEGKAIESIEFGAIFLAVLGRGLAQGWFSGHPYKVRPSELGGLQGVLEDLFAGNASAVTNMWFELERLRELLGESVGLR